MERVVYLWRLNQREHTIATLNNKISELQKVVARVLKSRDGQIEQNSLVDIKAWLSSSPAVRIYSQLHLYFLLLKR